MLRVVTFGAKLVAVAVLVGMFVAASSASPPRYVYRDVALVAVTGHGYGREQAARNQLSRQMPNALRPRHPPEPACSRCSRLAVHRLQEHASVTVRHATCVFDMVSSHDCVGGACPTGVFGVRARFVRDS